VICTLLRFSSRRTHNPHRCCWATDPSMLCFASYHRHDILTAKLCYLRVAALIKLSMWTGTHEDHAHHIVIRGLVCAARQKIFLVAQAFAV
jgi:hypothetical protein